MSSEMKPVAWIHKGSGKIRFTNANLTDEWLTLYAREELEIDPLKQDDAPPIHGKTERVWNYIKDRKAPFEAIAIAQHFGNTSSGISKHLQTLFMAGLITRIRNSNKVLWAVRHINPSPAKTIEPEVIELPKPPVKKEPPKPVESIKAKEGKTVKKEDIPQYVWPTSTFKTSYPHARGYDD